MSKPASVYRLKGKYNLTPEDVTVMLHTQEYSCAICRRTFTEANKPKIDHCHRDHDLPHVRGLLCNECNTGLGKFKDDPKLLAHALVYLEENQCDEG